MLAGMIQIAILISAGFTIGAALVGLMAIYQSFGMAALWGAVALLFVLHLALQRRGAGYYDPGGAFGGSGPVLPAPGKQALPGPAPRQITRPQRPALPGAKRSR
jgi:hypothetical protein